MSNKSPRKKKIWIITGVSLWLLAVIFTLLPIWPHVYYRLSPGTSEALASTIALTVTNNSMSTPTPSTTPSTKPEKPIIPLPKLDPSLPKENGLIIDKIGVRGEIHEGENWSEILKKGIWRVPNFGTPENTSLPIIIAAHRWGYLNWSASFRKLNSFVSLPNLKPEDEIEIIWNQRPYKYKVIFVSTGTQITDYTYDLILYTCQLWNSPTRFFVFANRIN